MVRSILAVSAALTLAGALPIWAQPPAPAPANPKAVMQRATDDLIRSGLAEKALQTGAKALDFTLPDAQGHPVTLSKLLAKGPVVLTFYRGGWCPYCNRQLKSYQDQLAQIHALGAELVAVSPERPDRAMDTIAKDALRFPVLTDVGNAVARRYGLVFRVADEVIPIYKGFGIDLEAANGDQSHELPMPGTYIIGPDGVIRLAFVQADYTKRLPVEQILEQLRQIH